MSTSPRDPAEHSGPDRPEGSTGAAPGRLDPWDPDLLRRLGVTVPNDARSLAPDRREALGLFGMHGMHGLQVRSVSGAPVRGGRLAGILTLCAMAVVIVLIASMGSVFAPEPVTPDRVSYPLAAHPAVAPGLVGGLLPDATVRLEEGLRVAARSLRPAVLFVPPTTTCTECAPILDNLWRQAAEYDLPVYLVVPLGRTDEARALMRSATVARPNLVIDARAMLISAYGGDVAQAVLIHADGIVGGVLRAPTADSRLEQLLSPLRFPGAPPSLRSAPAPA